MRKTSSNVKASSIPRSQQFSTNRQRLLYALLTFSSLTSGGAAIAAGTPLPTGGQFVAGAGAIAPMANGLAISQSSTHGIINWQSFSIAAGQTVNIANGTGATLNRVTGGDLSSIAGSLTATGSVYVVNTAGVVVLPGGKVVTGGSFVASTRDTSNSAFMAGGAMTLSGTSDGTVVNQGTITSTNGNVILVGKSVSNSGSITAAKGTAALAAADDVLLQESGDSTIVVNAGSGDVTNTGTISAAQARLDAVGGNVYALATNDGGVIRATGTATKDGHVYLTGGDGVSIDGTVAAANADGSGGTIVATASAVKIGATAKISANGTTKGGGTILLGGDRHGGTDASVALSKTPIANAKTTTVDAGATISADAGSNGKGGNVVVWSDQSTSYSGSISAKGGATSGDGGFVEVSGKQHLDFVGDVTTVAAKGVNGTLLLDPSDVTIVAGGAGTNGVTTTTRDTPSTTGGVTTFSPTGTGDTSAPTNGASPTDQSSYILNTDIQNALQNNSVVITTTNNNGNTANGDININAPISWSSNSSLSLIADGRINFSNINNTITTTGAGAITLSGGGNGVAQIGSGTAVNIVANISANGGLITIEAPNHGYQITVSNQTVISNTSNKGPGNIIMNADEVRLGSGFAPNAVIKTTGEVDIVPVTAGAIVVGNNDPNGDFTTPSNSALIDQADVSNITANLLVIGSTATTSLTVTTPSNEQNYPFFDAALAKNLKFLTGTNGTVTQDQNTPIIVYDTGAVATGSFNNATGVGTGGLSVQTGGAITLNNPVNSVGTIAFSETGSGGDISFARQGGETGTVVGTVGSGSAGVLSGITTTGSGRTVTLTANETITSNISGSMGSVPSFTQTAGAANAITTNNLVLQGNTTAYTLNNTSNSINNVSGTVQSLNLYDHTALTQTNGTTLTATGTGTGTTNASVQIVDDTDINLNSGSVISNAAGGDIQLETGTKFVSGGNATLSTTGVDTAAAGGHWRVYSVSPLTSGESKGGLTYGYIQYNTPNTPASPFTSTVQGTGNGFLYVYQPTVAETLTGTVTKVYDGNANAAAIGGAAGGTYGAVTGVVSGDSVVLSHPTTGTYQTSANVSTPDVYNAALVGVTGIAITSQTSTNSASQVVPVYNYGVTTTASTTGSITPSPLTIAGTKVYDNTTSFATNQLSITSAAVNSETVTLTAGTGTSSSANVATYTGSTLSNLAISVTGGNALASNYSLPATGTLTITPRTLSISGAKTYDGMATAPSGDITTFSGLQTGDAFGAGGDLTIGGTGVTGSANKGTYTGATGATAFTLGNLTLTGSAANNYTLAANTFTINAAPLTFTPKPVSVGYDGSTLNNATYSDVLSNYTVGTLQNGETISSAGISLTGSMAFNGSTTTAVHNAGSYALTAGTLAVASNNSNYTLSFTNPVPNAYVITKAPLTISGTKTYDGLANAPVADITTLSGTQTGDAFGAGGDLTLSGTAGVTGSANKGTYTGATGATAFTLGDLNLTGTAANNYTLTAGTFGITAAMLTVTPNAVSVGYNGSTLNNTTYSDTTSNYTFGGLQNGESATSAGISLTGSMAFNGSTTTAVHDAGSYALTAGTLAGSSNNGNYTLSFTNPVPNAYVITKAALTISGTKSYDGLATAPVADITTLSGTQTGDAFGAGGDLTLSGTAGVTGSANKGTYTGATGATAFTLGDLNLTGTAANNYTLTAGTFGITAAMLTVTPNAVSVGYNGSTLNNTTYSDTTSNYTFGTLQNGETISSAGISLTGSMAFNGSTTTAVHDAGSYALTAGTLAVASNNSNYSLSFTNPVPNAYVITKAALTISGTKSYDGLATAPVADITTMAGVQTGDAFGAGGDLTLSGTAGVTGSANKGTYTGATGATAFTLGDLNLTGTAANNYTLSAGTFGITAAMLTVTPNAVSVQYDGSTLNDTTYSDMLANYTVGNLQNGETVSSAGISLTGTMGFNGSTTTAVHNAGSYALTAGTLAVTSNNSNYALNFTNPVPNAYVITQAPIVVTGTKAYDANTNFSVSQLTVASGAVTGETVTLTAGTGMSSSPNAATYTNSPLSNLAISVTGTGASTSNYALPATGTLTITPAGVTVAMVFGERVYDGTTNALGSLLTVTDKASPTDDVSLTGTGMGALASKNVGTQNITSFSTYSLTGAQANNYTLTGASGTVKIDPATLTISGSKSYDGMATAPVASIGTFSGVQTGDAFGAGGDLTLSGTAGVTGSANKGTYTGATGATAFTLGDLNLTGTAAGNYTLAAGTFGITAAMLNVTPNAVSIGYNGATLNDTTYSDTLSNYTIGGLQNGETTATAGISLTGTMAFNGSTTTAVRNAASYALTAGTLAVASNNSNYTLNFTNPVPNAYVITKANLTIAAVTQTKVYDGGTASTGTPTITGLQAGDTVSASPLTQAFNSKNVAGTNGSTLSVTNYTGVNDGNGGGNYNVTVNTAMGTITPLAVTLSGTRTYDGMTDAAGSILAATNDLDGANLTIGGTGVLAGKNVGTEGLTSTNGSLTGLTLGGSAATNYTLASATGSVNVTKAGLVISAVTQTKTYDGTTTSTGTPTITGLQTGDTVSASPLTQAFNSKNVAGTNGSTLSVTNYTGVNDGNGGGNYNVTVNTAMGTITPLAVTLSGTRTYDGMTDAAGSILAATNDLDGANLTIGGTGVLAGKNVGTEGLTSTNGSLTGLTLSGSAATNYTLASATGSVNVTKAGLVISAVTQTKTYDGTTTSTGTPTVTGLQTGDSVSASPLTQAFNSKNVAGTNGSTLSVTNYTGVNDGNGGGNYNVTVNTAMGTITPLAVTLSGTRTYDGMTDAPSAILSFGNDLDGGNLTVSGTGVLVSKNVGTEGLTSTSGALTGLTLGGSAAGNYTLTGASGSVAVTKAALTISAVTQTKVYDGGTASTGTPTITGLQAGDTVSASPLTQAFNSKNVAGTNGSTLSVTNYTGVNDGNGGGNYNVTVNTAMGTITPLAVTLSGTRTYDGMTDAAGSILAATNDLDGANLTIGGTGVLAGKNVGTEGLTSTNGSLTGLTLGGSAATNYTLASATGSVNVTKAGLVISAVTQTKTYDGTTTSTGTPTITGLQTGDTVSASPLTQAFNSKNVAGTNGSTLSVTNYTGVNDGNGGGNYNVTVNTAMGTITPLAVTLSGTRTYDGMTDAAGSILAATNDLDGANLTIGGTGVLAGKNVGTEGLTSTNGSLTGLTLSGSAATNYTLASATGSVNVTKAGLVISAVTQTKTYDGTTTSTGTPTITGLQAGDTVSASPLTQAFNSKNVAGTNGSTLSVTNYTGVNDGNGGGNYNVTVNTAMGTITPLAVTLSGTRVYDGMTDAPSAILSATNDVDGGNLTIGGTGVLAGKNAGTEGLTSTGGSLTGLTLGGSAAGNYTLTGASGSVAVTKAGLTISAVTQTKVYDGTTTSTGTPTVVGLQTGDSLTYSSGNALAQAYASKNVLGTNGSTLMVTNFSGVSDTNGGGNYNVTVKTAMGTITPLAVTLTGTRTYDGMTDAAGSILSATNDVDGGNLTIGGTGVLVSKNAGTEGLTSTSGALTGLTLGGSAAGNYTLTGGSGSVAVTKANLTVAAVTQTKVYDNTTISTGTPTVTGLQTGDSITLSSGSSLAQAFNSKNVAGTNGSTLTVTNFAGVSDGNGGANYNTPVVNTALGTITPLAVTLTGTRVYDGMTDAAGSILSATNDLDGGNLTIGGTGVLVSKNAGTEGLTSTSGALTGLTLGGSAAGNYTLTGGSGSVAVTKAALTLSAVTQTKVYDGTTTSTGTPTVVGLQTGDSVTLSSGNALAQAYASKNVAGTNGSTLMITNFSGVNDGNGGANYSTPVVNTALGTITPLAVTLAGTRVYDGMTDAAGSILSATNDVDGANLTIGGTGVLAGKNVGAEALTSTPTTGTLTGLTLGGSAAGNYTLMGASGSVAVTKANLVISAVTQTKVYDGGTVSTGTPTTVGLQTGDSVSGSPLTQAYGSKNVLGVNGSTLSVNNFTAVNDGNGGANYNVVVNTAPGTITPLAVTETGTRVYNGTPGVNGSIITIANAVPGDVVGVTGTGTLGGKDTGTQTITSPGTLALTGGDAGNYTMTGGTSAITITPFTVNLAGTRVYDGMTDGNAPILAVTNAFAGDTVTVASGTSTIASKNVGPEAITNFGTLALGGAQAGDYTLTGGTGTVTVTPLAVILAGTRVYNGLTDGNSSILGVTNAIGGDTPTVASGTSTIASKNVGAEGITNFGTLALGNNAAGNYTLVGASGVVTVTPLAIAATGTRVYNGTPGVDGSILTITDKVTGDVVGITGTGTLSGKDRGTQTVTNPGTLALTGTDAGNYTVTGGTESVTITPFVVNLAGTRVYDGLTDGNAPILSVTNAFAGDTVTVASGTSTIASKNVGREGITNFGTLALGNNAAGDYTLVGATGVVTVTPLALTVTAVNTPKTYDGTTTSSGTPVITVGSLQGTDTGAFIQQFGTKNAGTGLTLTPSGIVTDANGGNNYVVTFVPIATGVINPKAVIVTGTRPFDNTPAALGSILTITNLVPGDIVTLGGTGTLASPTVGPEAVSSFTGLTLAGGPAANYTFVGASGIVTITPSTPVTPPIIGQLLAVPATQTASGGGETVSFSAFEGGILTLTPRQNGIVTGTIATVDGNDVQPDSQLGCTIGSEGCVQNGVAVAPTAGSAPAAQ